MLATARGEATFRISVVMQPLNFPGFNRVPRKPLVAPPWNTYVVDHIIWSSPHQTNHAVMVKTKTL